MIMGYKMAALKELSAAFEWKNVSFGNIKKVKCQGQTRWS